MRLVSFAGLVASAATTVNCVQQLSHALNSHVVRDTPVEIPLDVFQIQAPVRENYDGLACSQTIVQSDFTASYGSPYVGIYNPPSNCNFTTVVFNMTVTSEGINYDRLALLYFGDIEVWRSTTAMPVRTGIYYSFTKDMTAYIPLLRQQQKVILQLDNIYDSVFTGNFNVTITALYYNDDTSNTSINPPDIILPISSMSSSQNLTSVFSLPDGNASVSLTLPRNVERAVVSVFASGNGNEEFWYTDVPAAFTSTFNNSFASGHGPWREVQVLLDGRLAGVVWPFPIVFTGGISPGLWVPIVGIDTYDLGSVDVDVSPWLGILCDGGAHVFELKVVGYDSTTTLGTVASNWWVSGEVFLWLDEGGNQTTAGTMYSESEGPDFDVYSELTTSSNGTNSSLLVGIRAHRELVHSTLITTSKGTRNITWGQSLSYENVQNFTAAGNNETLWQRTNGSSTSTSATDQVGEQDNVALLFDYPISFFQSYVLPSDYTAANSTLYAILDRTKLENGYRTLSHLVYPNPDNNTLTAGNSQIHTRQNGSCFYLWNNTYYEEAGAIDPAIGTIGATDQWFNWKGFVETDEGRELQNYSRYASAIDGYEPVLKDDATSDQDIYVPPTEVVTGEGVNELVLSGAD